MRIYNGWHNDKSESSIWMNDSVMIAIEAMLERWEELEGTRTDE